MKCILNRDMPGDLDPSTGRPVTIPAGTEIDDPGCWELVRMGVAYPADAECEKRSGLSPEQLSAARDAATKLMEGRSTGKKEFDAPSKHKRSMADAAGS
ncbi:MAG: hypothetical protein AB7G12_12785 [Thermoanaerobaculia bacterium]